MSLSQTQLHHIVIRLLRLTLPISVTQGEDRPTGSVLPGYFVPLVLKVGGIEGKGQKGLELVARR